MTFTGAGTEGREGKIRKVELESTNGNPGREKTAVTDSEKGDGTGAPPTRRQEQPMTIQRKKKQGPTTRKIQQELTILKGANAPQSSGTM
jgi:hypothetical protein